MSSNNIFESEWLKVKERYSEKETISKEFCLEAINYILQKVDENIITFKNGFPPPASSKGIYEVIGNTDWTSSFWTGMLWLSYEVTGDEKYRIAAEEHLDSYQERLDKNIATDTHDLGFLYSLSCVAAYKLTGSEIAKKIALQAADMLMTRYFEKAGIIQAWGNLNDPEQRGRMIIDCCMNLPLLYWAYEMTGDRKYYDVAYNHAKQSVKHIIREDASTFHTFYMDVETGEPRFGKTAQGFADDSCWARGQAWGIYGLVLSYIYNFDGNLVDESKKLTNYFLSRLPEDSICYWDLSFTSGDEERDSSAAAIASCGLLEMTRHLPLTDECKAVYENALIKMVKSLVENYTTKGLESNGLLAHGVYSKPGSLGVDECNLWGDYFYFEALVRLVKDWQIYW